MILINKDITKEIGACIIVTNYLENTKIGEENGSAEVTNTELCFIQSATKRIMLLQRLGFRDFHSYSFKYLRLCYFKFFDFLMLYIANYK